MAWKVKIEVGKKLAGLIQNIADQIIGCCCCAACKARIKFSSIQIGDVIVEGDIMAVTITDTQEFILAAQGTDKKGKPALLDGAVVFTPADPVLIVTPIDNLSAKITVGDVSGVTLPFVTQVAAAGDADLGAGSIPVLATPLAVTIIASQAVNISLTPGTPTQQP